MATTDTTGTTGTTGTVDEHLGTIVEALVKVISDAADEDSRRARNLMLQRLATTGDVVPARVQPPGNVTEVGGYLNLLEQLGEPILRAQVLASILGVAGPNPPVGFDPPGPTRFVVTRANDRPPGPAQPSIPFTFKVRDDFAVPLDATLDTIRAHGGRVPILRTIAPLPPVDREPDGDPLAYTGRELLLVPAAALRDPDGDPLAVARPDGGGELRTVARVLDETAPAAGDVNTLDWVAWSCDATSCTESTGPRRFIELAAHFAAAGWYQDPPSNPSVGSTGGWERWTNITGLVAGTTTLGDELRSLHGVPAIVGSSLRERMAWVWDGSAFRGKA